MFSKKPAIAEGVRPPILPTAARPPLPPAQLHNSLAKSDPTASSPISAEEGLVTIGIGTRVTGKIEDCRKLDVHGILEADVIAETVIVRSGGGIKGTIETSNAEIHGTVDGLLLVHEHLDVRSTGELTGDFSYRSISIETGAKIVGNIKFHQEPERVQEESPRESASVLKLRTQDHDIGKSVMDHASYLGDYGSQN